MNVMCWILFICLFQLTFSDAKDEVKGSAVVYVQNGAKAEFKWEFNFPYSRIFTYKLTHISLNNVPSSPDLAGYRNRQLLKGENPNFKSRITATKTNNGLIVDLINTRIEDQGYYKLFVEMNQFGYSAENTTQLIVKVPPNIDKYVPRISKSEGEYVSLPCITTAGNPKPMQFTWYKKDKSGQFRPISATVEAYDRYSLNISSVGRINKGDYRCQASNIGGFDRYNIYLEVRYRPVVVIPPLNRTVFQDRGTEEFNCEADGNPPAKEYYWYEGSPAQAARITQNTNYIRIENSGKRLKFVKPPRKLATIYYCAASNILGTGEAVGAYLNVTYAPEKVRVENEENGVVNINEGTNVTVKCVSSANPPARYTWEKLGKNWRGQAVYNQLVINSYSGELTLYNVTTNTTGKYKCIAENFPDSSDLSQKYAMPRQVDIKVRYGPRHTNFTVNGTAYTVIEIRKGDQAELRCLSFSEPAADYKIKLKTANPTLNPNKKIGVYKISKMSINEQGTYECIASNPILRKEQRKEIKVIISIPPEKLPPYPQSRTVTEGAHFEMTCNAKGKPPPKVYWQRFGANITRNDSVVESEYYDVHQDGLLTTITAKLKFKGIRYTDSAGYSCIVYNSAGSQNLTATYTVEFKPKITHKPQNHTVREDDGQVVRFVCGAVSNPPTPKWTWFFNGVEQSEDTGIFTRSIPKRSDNGKYVCLATNSMGPGENATAYLTVEYKPSITYISAEQIVNVGDRVTMNCDATGVPPPVISWTNSLNSKFKYTGKKLVLTNLKATNEGVYSCSATNIVNADTRSTKLFIKHVPVITTTSPSQTKFGGAVGQSAYLRCITSSYPAANITWTEVGRNAPIQSGFNGFRITENFEDFGSSSSLSVTVTESILGKEYLCKAANILGEATQPFQILKRGKPEKPVKLDFSNVLVPTVPVTVNITIKWDPGYDGGYAVTFVLLYRKKGDVAFREHYIGAGHGNEYIFPNRQAGTTYEFSMKARNKMGISAPMQAVEFSTDNPPKDVANVTIVRESDGTSVVIFWQILSPPSTRTRRAVVVNKWEYGQVRYRMVNEVDNKWAINDILNIKTKGSIKIENLDSDKLYEFHFILFDSYGGFGNPVLAGKLYPGKGPTTSESSGLSKTDIIALIVGIGGAVLLIVLISMAIIICRKRNKKGYSKNYNNGRVQMDIPVSTMKSNYSNDVVRASYLNDEDPFAVDTSIIDDNDKSPPPAYNSVHHTAPPEHDDYTDTTNHGQFRNEETTPSYTSFGRIQPKKQQQQPQQPPNDRAQSKSMTSLNGTRATEISRRNDNNRHSMDALDDYPERRQREEDEPLIRNTDKNEQNRNRQQRNSRGRLSSDEDLPEPPPFMRDALRSHPSDEDNLNNRVPGAFGDRGGRFKKPSPKPYEEPPSQPAPPPTGRLSPAPSSIASSKPYRSDNEYIDDADDNYVGYLV